VKEKSYIFILKTLIPYKRKINEILPIHKKQDRFILTSILGDKS